MRSKELQEDKIKEVLEALKDAEGNPFLLCISLFYLGVHLIDLHLIESGYDDVGNHGDRGNKLRQIDQRLFVAWKSLLSTSNDQRYQSITSSLHIAKLKEDLLEIISIITLPDEVRSQVENLLTSIQE